LEGGRTGGKEPATPRNSSAMISVSAGFEMPLDSVDGTWTPLILTRFSMTRDEKEFDGCENGFRVLDILSD
jgi:hypothetical protein